MPSSPASNSRREGSGSGGSQISSSAFLPCTASGLCLILQHASEKHQPEHRRHHKDSTSGIVGCLLLSIGAAAQHAQHPPKIECLGRPCISRYLRDFVLLHSMAEPSA